MGLGPDPVGPLSHCLSGRVERPSSQRTVCFSVWGNLSTGQQLRDLVGKQKSGKAQAGSKTPRNRRLAETLQDGRPTDHSRRTRACDKGLLYFQKSRRSGCETRLSPAPLHTARHRLHSPAARKQEFGHTWAAAKAEWGRLKGLREEQRGWGVPPPKWSGSRSAASCDSGFSF